MSTNPYQTPASAPGDIPPPMQSHADLVRLRGIAAAQRNVMLCILAQFVVLFGSRFLPQDQPGTQIIVGLGYILLAIATFVFTVQLASRLKGTGVAIAVGILSIIPLIGLLVLLVVSGWATKAIRQAGFKVGLLGGNPGQIQKAIDALGSPA